MKSNMQQKATFDHMSKQHTGHESKKESELQYSLNFLSFFFFFFFVFYEFTVIFMGSVVVCGSLWCGLWWSVVVCGVVCGSLWWSVVFSASPEKIRFWSCVSYKLLFLHLGSLLSVELGTQWHPRYTK